MNLGLRRQQSGDLTTAAGAFRDALQLAPANAAAMHYLGVALYQLGRHDEGLAWLRKAIRRDPGNAIFHNNLGHALDRHGRHDEAAECHRRATRIDPGFADAWFNLGIALQALGAYGDATSAYRQAIALRPTHAKSHFNLGQACRAAGLIEEAVEACATALRIHPGYALCLQLLAGMLCELGRHDEAIARLRQALAVSPGDPVLLATLGRALDDNGDSSAADGCYEGASARATGNAAVRTSLGHAMQLRGDHERAIDHFRAAIALDCDNADAYLGLAGSKRFAAGDDPMIGQIEAALGRTGSASQKRIALHFALGKIHDDRGEHDLAFAHYQHGNQIKCRTLPYDRAGHEQLVAGIMRVFSGRFVTELAGRSGHDSLLPVFIIGMPRSGTTLVEQILAAHPEVVGRGELPHIMDIARSMALQGGNRTPYPECVEALAEDVLHAYADEYLQRLRLGGNPAALRVTDKMPANFLHVGLIAALFKNARIIHCMRDPMDVCLSIYFQLFSNPHPYAYDLEDVAHYHRQYEHLMAHWRQEFPGRIHEIRYADLVENPEHAIRSLIEHVGVPWNNRCLEFHQSTRRVGTASQWQVRQPIYKSSVHRWRNYERHLQPLLAALGRTA
jgi:tetratricopeptide (TPR) repeat protein